MTDLEKLQAEVQVGWTVKIVDHDHLNDSRDDVTVDEVRPDGLTLRAKKPWSSQGRKYPTMNFTWANKDEVDGHRVRLYHTPPARTGKARRLIKTFVFTPPKEY